MATAKAKQLLLIVAVALSWVAVAVGRRRPVHLHLYMHDVIRGPNQTAIQLIWGVGPAHTSMPGRGFGDTVAVDDVVTDGPDMGSSRAVGRAQGSYMLSSQHEQVLVVSITVVLTEGPYNGSTIVVAGRDRVQDETRELAVVGGTGLLRRAAGYVLWRTAKIVSDIHMVLELDIHASVPVPTHDSSLAIESE